MNEAFGIAEIRRYARAAARLAAAALLGLSATACTAAAASPIAVDSSASPGLSAAATIEASVTAASASPSTLEGATFTVGPIPTVNPAPTGAWTGIHWIAGPLMSPPAATADPLAKVADETSTQFTFSGWSRGYLGFTATQFTPQTGDWALASIIPSSSVDGLHWTAGKALDISGLDMTGSIGTVVEGPAGLLAPGYPQAAVCGGPNHLDAMWRSTDGVAWKRLSMGAFGGASVYRIEAGSAGYIAAGTSAGSTPVSMVWTSKDAITWTAANLTTALFRGAQLSNATAFSGGFVLAGAVPSDEGCGGPGSKTPSLWWSRDGKSWTRDVVPGTTSGIASSMSVARISDRTLLAQQTTWDDKTQTSTQMFWTSADGRTWKPNAGTLLRDSRVITDGNRTILVDSQFGTPGHQNLWTIDDDASIVALRQTGDVPPQDVPNAWEFVLGPNGVVAANGDGTQFWVGVPTVA